MRGLFLTFLFLSFLTNYSHGMVARDLIIECEKKISEQGICIGYISSSYDSHNFNVFNNLVRDDFICFPDNLSIGQLIDVFLKYAKDNPHRQHLVANQVFLDSVATYFPCDKNK